VNDADRLKLLGSYRTPPFRVGQKVHCEVRGEVTICGVSDAPIPWPLCRVGKRRAPVVYKGLARAVRRESEQAVAHWWGISPWSVWHWRKALGVGAVTAGTRLLKREHWQEPWADQARGGCKKCLEKQPRFRYAGLGELMDAFGRFAVPK
jgi:hypothetical protein